MSAGSIGTTLKDARSRQSLTLEEVHAKIKIHPRVLQLLEEEKFDKLPSPLFAKSFLKSYAQFLNVDAEEVMRAYEKVEKKEPEQVLFIKPPELRGRTASGFDKRWVAVPLAGALAVGLGFGGFALVKLAAGAVSGWKPPALFVPSVKKAPAPKAAPPPVPPPVPAKASEKKAPSEWLRSPELGNFPNIPKQTPLELKIKAVDNVWMRVTVDGKIAFQSILKRGTAEAWTAREGFEIWTGNSSNMVLSLNGFSLGSPGKGVVKKLTISHRGVKIPR